MTVPDNNLPTFAETDLTDIWRYRQEFKEEEDHGKTHRHHAEQELFKRAAEADATILQTEHGPVEISYPNTYAYNSAVVDKDFFALIERDGLTEEWNQFVSHAYKIDKRWLNRLAKRGQEYQEVIEKMTSASRGSPSLKGPSLQEMGGYAPREEEVAI
jgi:hypothetical protein